MLSIILAYATDNQRSAQRLAGDLESHVAFTHVPVGKANEGPLLVELLPEDPQPVILLISSDFLQSPNCMYNAHPLFDGTREVLPVFIRSHHYDELADEVITSQTSLSNQADVMHYINHWQDRYIDLRAQADELSVAGGDTFQKYLRKIREASTQAEELLYLLKDKWSLTEEQFAANHYHQLFLFAERPRLWEDYKAYEETPVDVSGIPGLAMLGSNQEETSAPEEEPVLGADAGAAEEDERTAETTEPDTLEDPAVINDDLAASVVPLQEEAEVLPISGEHNEEPVVVTAETLSPEEQAATWVSRAWSMFDQGDAVAGLELLASGRDALPDHPILHYNHALLLVTATEDIAAAQEQLEGLLDKFPDHPEALFLNGELAEAGQDVDRARENWEQLSDTEPFYPDLNFRLGTLIDDHYPDDYLDAAAYLRRATKETGASGDAFYRYGRLLAGPIGRKKKAIKQLRRAIELAPNHADAHYLLAQLLKGRGDVAAAKNAFQVAASLNPKYQTMDNQAIFADPPAKPVTTASAADALAALKEDIAALEAELAAQNLATKTDMAPAAPPKKGAGKTALISGATSGIGRATARRLAADGYRLLLLGRRQERLDELSNELQTSFGTETFLIKVDVRHREEVRMVIANLPHSWKTIDLLLNNAGKAKGFDPIHTGDYEHWDEMIDVNLKGLLTLTREVSPLMVARQSGMIINVASTAGKEVYPNGNVYCATKHAVDALTYAMRLDLVKHGIRVGQICPAHVEETEFAVVRFDGDKERAKIYEDFKPLSSPDVAEAIYFMASQPAHVNIMDVVLQGTQQASSTVVDRSGRDRFSSEEE